MERDYENTLMPTLKSNGLSQIPFYGLARGFLTGKYRKGKIVESVRANGVNTSYSINRGWTMIEKLDQIAKDKNTSIAAVALAWLRAQPTVAASIASATRVDQIKEIFPMLELDSKTIKFISSSLL